MITELRVRDLATIADVTLHLAPGLNVLTGETGTGKSLLVDALALLLGGRADPGAIRPGATRASVEGAIDDLPRAAVSRLEALGIEPEDDRLLLRREIALEGRSRAWINGSPATAAMLSQVGQLLVDLHGQHDTQSLLQGATQRTLLDAFAGAAAEVAEVRAAHAAVAALRAEEGELDARQAEARRKGDYLCHVVAEIDAARIQAGDEERIEGEARRLGQADAITAHAADLLAALEDGDQAAGAALARARRVLAALGRLDPDVTRWEELLDSAAANLDELVHEAREYAAGVDGDPSRLAALEARRDLLYRLRQKHGGSLAAVLETRRVAAVELELLDTADTDLRALAVRRSAAETALAAAAGQLTLCRRDGADRLARGVNRLLPRLGLAGGRLAVDLRPVAVVGPAGAEEVEFLVQLNAGLEPRPLARVASGGELSRLMLALKVLLARHDAVSSLVFDEVDQGIGGEVGAQVGAALADVATGRQVLVITHLPQIAARAGRHLVVAKRARGGVATSDVRVLHGEDRVIELARMLGDPDAETARRHALALLGAEAPRAARGGMGRQ